MFGTKPKWYVVFPEGAPGDHIITKNRLLARWAEWYMGMDEIFRFFFTGMSHTPRRMTTVIFTEKPNLVDWQLI